MYRDPHQVSASIARQVRARASDALYVISVAARLVEMHPTTLRKYERVGFLEPSRTPGRTNRLRQIKRLVEEREMNLAGVQMALDLTEMLSEISTAIEQAPDVATVRRRVQAPLRAAFATLGALD